VALNGAIHNSSLYVGAQKIKIPEWDEAINSVGV